MLSEILKVRQIPGEAQRRWFQDEGMDLFVWVGQDEPLIGFQLTYDKPHAEKAITWKHGVGFLHSRIDEGVRPGRHPASPLLVADGTFEPVRVLEEFRARAAEIDPTVRELVAARLGEYPSSLTP